MYLLAGTERAGQLFTAPCSVAGSICKAWILRGLGSYIGSVYGFFSCRKCYSVSKDFTSAWKKDNWSVYGNVIYGSI